MVFLVPSLRQYAFQLVDCSLNGWCNSRCVKLALLSSRSYLFYLRFLSLFSSLFLSLFYLFLSRFHCSFYYSYFIFIIGSTVFVLVFIGVLIAFIAVSSPFSPLFLSSLSSCLLGTSVYTERTHCFAGLLRMRLSPQHWVVRGNTNDKQVTMQLLSIKKKKKWLLVGWLTKE